MKSAGISKTAKRNGKPNKTRTSRANKRNIHPKSFWEKHVEAYLAGEFNKSQYCRQHELSYHSFLYWCDRLKIREKAADSGGSFIPVKLKSTTPTEINRFRLYLHTGIISRQSIAHS